MGQLFYSTFSTCRVEWNKGLNDKSTHGSPLTPSTQPHRFSTKIGFFVAVMAMGMKVKQYGGPLSSELCTSSPGEPPDLP